MYQNPKPRSIAELGKILERNQYMNTAMNGFNVRKEAERAERELKLAERLGDGTYHD